MRYLWQLVGAGPRFNSSTRCAGARHVRLSEALRYLSAGSQLSVYDVGPGLLGGPDRSYARVLYDFGFVVVALTRGRHLKHTALTPTSQAYLSLIIISLAGNF